MPNPEVTVIVCTLNRASALDRCLEHLAASGSQLAAAWEVIVVDNGSTDDTPDVVTRWTELLPVSFLRENRRGLSVARNTGLRAAAGRITAFIDDDCIASREWLRAILAAHARLSGVAGIGGRVSLWVRSDLPVSLRDFDDATEIEDLQAVMSRLIGCNFSARTDVLRAIGGFDQRLGTGTAAMSGEDLDLFYRMLRAGFRLSYDPAVHVFHAHGRTSNEQLSQLMRGYLIGRGACYAKHALRADRAIIRSAYWEIRRLLAAMRNAKRSPADEPLSPGQMVTALARGAWLRVCKV